MSWNQGFATDYQERGNIPLSQPHPSYPNNVYPSSPTSKSPTYNRSAAPFHPVHSQGQVYQEPAMNGYPASYQQAYNPPPYQPHPSASMSKSLDAQVVDKREQPEIDEDFPSYKDLRNVFLQKQQLAEVEERRASTLPRRLFGHTSIQSNQPGRKPPPTPPKKPVNLVSPGASSRNRVITKSSSYQQQSQVPQAPVSRSTVQVTSQTRSNYPGQTPATYQPPANTYTEIPVQHATRTTERTQAYESQQQTPRRVELGYRPPMSINVTSPYTGPSYDGSSPRVKITSNSPMSPQRAWYRPDDETDDLIIPRQTGRRHSVSFAPMMMSSSANQPRRRTSYAEIFIGSTPQSPMPRDLSASSPGLVQKSFTRVTTNRVVNGVPDTKQDESFPSFRELKSQFSRQESNDLNRGQQAEPFGVTYSSRQNQQHDGDFTRVNMRRPSQQSRAQPEMMQRQAPGWSATVQTGNGGSQPVIRAGPNVHYVPSARQPGRTAAHLQYNSPMGLYPASKAQEALNRDPEAAELLKISGQQSSQTLINSPTLKAVLKEDNIKRQTGRKADVGYYHNHREYGPGIGPLRQYEEVPDTLRQTITLYNQNQDKSLTYPMWCAL